MSYELNTGLQAESGRHGGQYGNHDFQDFTPEAVLVCSFTHSIPFLKVILFLLLPPLPAY